MLPGEVTTVRNAMYTRYTYFNDIFAYLCQERGNLIQISQGVRPGLVVPILVLSLLLCVDTCFYNRASGRSDNNIFGF